KAVHYHARRCTPAALGSVSILDMAAEIGFVEAAIELVDVAAVIGLRCAIGRSNGNLAKEGLQWLKQGLAQNFASGDREVGVIRNVSKATNDGDFRIEKIAQEEILAQPDAPELFECLDGFGVTHDVLRL